MQNVQSPRNDDAGIEAEILARGLTAPRVTPDELERNIVSAHYFTAAEGVAGHGLALTLAGAEAVMPATPSTIGPLMLLKFCVLVLRNGFTVTGESACASPENFDAQIGRRLARANAVNKVWPLMGYQLREQLHQQGGQQP